MYYTIKKRKSDIPGYQRLSIRVIFSKGNTWDKSLGISVKEGEYNAEKRIIPKDLQANQRLQDAMSAFRNSLIYLQSEGKFTREQFIEAFNARYQIVKIVGTPAKKPAKSTNLESELQAHAYKGMVQYEITQQIRSKGIYGSISAATRTSYHKVRNHVIHYRPDWRMDQIDVASLEGFKGYFYDKDIGVYTFNRMAKEFKTLLKRYSDRVMALPDSVFKDSFFEPMTFHNSPKPYFTEQEIDTLYNLELPDGELSVVRDGILFGCYTGLRFGDWDIGPTDRDATGKALVVLNNKTKKYTRMLIHPRLQAVLDRYQGYSPKVAPEGIKHPDHYFNARMKQVCKIAGLDRPFSSSIHRMKSGINEYTKPLYEVVSSHDCRRSFATNMVLNGVPARIVMAYTGHTTEAMLNKYVQVSNEEVTAQLSLDTFIKAFGS